MTISARRFAVKAHGNQTYGMLPYEVHLDAVASIAKPYGDIAEIVAFLHDVVEDTAITEADIAAEFGEFVADCVSILTDEPGDTRAERKVATYQKMAKVEGQLCLALLVKAADRLANMRASVNSSDKSYFAVYQSEYPVFKQSVYRANLCDDIWNELDTIMSNHAS